MKLFTLELREIVREGEVWAIRWKVLASSANRSTIERYRETFSATYQPKHLRVIVGG